MKRISAIAVLCLCLMHLNVSAQNYFDLNSQQYVGEEDVLETYEIIDESDNNLIVSYSLGTATLVEDELFPTTFNLSIDKLGQHYQDGEPMLPMADKLIYLPEGKTYSYIRLINSEFVELAVELAPSRYILSDNDTIGWQKSRIQPIGTTTFSSPDSIIRLEYAGKKLGKNVCRISIAPVQYDSEVKKFEYTRIFHLKSD